MHPLLLLAMAPDVAAAAPQQLNPLQKLLGPLAGNPLMPLILIFGVFYLFIIRPQQQKQKELETQQKRIAPGDEVVTTGGLVGKVTHATDEILTVEVGDKVRVRVLRGHVNARPAAADKAAADKTSIPKEKDKASA